MPASFVCVSQFTEELGSICEWEGRNGAIGLNPMITQTFWYVFSLSVGVNLMKMKMYAELHISDKAIHYYSLIFPYHWGSSNRNDKMVYVYFSTSMQNSAWLSIKKKKFLRKGKMTLYCKVYLV